MTGIYKESLGKVYHSRWRYNDFYVSGNKKLPSENELVKIHFQKGAFLRAITKEQLQHIIKDNNIKSGGDIYSLFKDIFNDMLQELLEAERLQHLVMKKIKKGLLLLITSAMDIRQKMKSQFGQLTLHIT